MAENLNLVERILKMARLALGPRILCCGSPWERPNAAWDESGLVRPGQITRGPWGAADPLATMEVALLEDAYERS